jgi:two-component system KDP operon response regulator KdpE
MARVGEKLVPLTPTEFEVCKALANRNGFITTADLLHTVWGPAYRTELDYVRIYVRRIRQKLEGIGFTNPIESRPGQGYRLRSDETPIPDRVRLGAARRRRDRWRR